MEPGIEIAFSMYIEKKESLTSQVWAILCVRDDVDIAPYTIKQLFGNGIDGMIVSISHLSNDGTREKVVELAKTRNIQVVVDDSPSFYYHQGEITTRLAHAAHELGADWIVPFDADEMVYCKTDTVADRLRNSKVTVIQIPLWNYFSTSHDDITVRNPCIREQWRKIERNPLNKVCFRWQPSIACANGNHSVAINDVTQWGEYDSIDIGHFQNRTPDRMIRKIRGERMVRNDNDPEYGYWHKFATMTDEEIVEWWKRDYYFTDPASQGLVHDPAPYHGD